MLILKIIVSVCFIFTLGFSATAIDADSISAKSAIVINRETKEIVFGKNAYEKRSMASTTKIMTALLACESGRLYEVVTVTPQMCGAEGTSLGLKAGYKLRLYDLVSGMMLKSGNDAANAVAIFLAGSLEGFARMMNDKAYKIGMRCTNFVTPSGLDDENHYTTAYDMALLGAYAMENIILKNICSQKTMKIDYINPDIRTTYSNHNKLLSYYSGTYGIKTGFTKKSGRCLVSAVEGEKGDFICVTLSASDDWNDHKKLFDYAFDVSVKTDVNISAPEYISVEGGVFSSLRINTEAVKTLFLKADTEIKQTVYLPEFIYAPVNKGDIIGAVRLTAKDRIICEVPITADESCSRIEARVKEKKSILERIKEILHIR